MANKIVANLEAAYGVTYEVQGVKILKTNASVAKDGVVHPSPVDAVSMALGGCMLAGVRDAANKHNLSVDGTSLEIEAIMKDAPRRIGEFKIDIHFKNDFSEKEKMSIERSIKGCPVANSLNAEIVKTITYHYAK